MLVPRVLVPVDVEVARAVGGTERPRDDITLAAPAVAVYGSQAGSFALRKELFAEAMLENSPTRPPRRTADFIVSATAPTLFLTGLLLLPLYFGEAIDIHQFNKTPLAAPLPPAPPPPPASPAAVRPLTPKRNAASRERHFVAPTVLPHQVARVTEEPRGDDLGSLTLPGEGVPEGLAGSVIGGALLGPASAAPIDSAPKEPIRVGGQVKRPRLIFGPEPVYRLLARHSRISGAVVIDALIGTQGNVVDMRPASGNPLLLIGQWRRSADGNTSRRSWAAMLIPCECW